ncbi:MULTISPECIES: aminotransferase class I/II-fold pyridoxal phosphate-dependent enzyme [Weeksella]|uniref:DegT/DnrJ/EryC1/StrS aminotransferase n=1 Tax=Weeksella virosa (strain ATCC 43766 / DSM 16922 / JCM 21250 / CCUG 30538 / CDC 9751 / IAM 14551 / NBRC 16016 / NCTC 11634 / CL345/78) TaxID=865938 RepID=F0P2A3_WEEVC|nr:MULTISPECIES: aminotransferase class I/II-fold pyridoxal phosphate-dependent enzyme [Weeksella]ADX67793.1 DegT/DnrJ/EryC1/StrS aminotransferase [Weeksella virosa DSM 16922]MDK7374082.1 aminotransferase class I/II-fold pyridoxal phosphate-dependent enzyme [Weeksella virosa]MDK7674337.1 aminotransferase class I/II-fold pyridoxal phosphate-dependent enzyme [Weeksella virosa]OFM82766.1 pyridoxal phosphate-dependent aminotransferase [Weeksella sp. HMSC059D05]SUP54093.1 UDP-4-amino-4-deoxy-L-arab
MKDKIWLSSPHMGGRELDFIHEAFDQNWVAPLGPNVNGFEDDLTKFLNDDVYVAALSAGTAALHLGLIILGVKADDEVICQSLTFSASANPIRYQGATPIFIDSEPDTWNMCPIALERAIQDRLDKGKKPKAIIPVHLYGMPYKIEEIQKIADQYAIPILEDAAEALGSTYKGRHCGTFGHLAALSFNGNKIITTSGGGALVAHSEKEKQQAVFLSTQARDAAPHYQHSQIGYNYRMSNISAGIGRGQMLVLEDHIAKRRAIHQFYKEIFSTIEGVKVFDEPSSDYFSNHWLSAITIDSEKTNGKTAEQLRLALEKENIESRPIWKPMHLQPVFEMYPYYGTTIAEDIFSRGLCLPSGSNLSEADLVRIKNAILDFFA